MRASSVKELQGFCASVHVCVYAHVCVWEGGEERSWEYIRSNDFCNWGVPVSQDETRHWVLHSYCVPGPWMGGYRYCDQSKLLTPHRLGQRLGRVDCFYIYCNELCPIFSGSQAKSTRMKPGPVMWVPFPSPAIRRPKRPTLKTGNKQTNKQTVSQLKVAGMGSSHIPSGGLPVWCI